MSTEQEMPGQEGEVKLSLFQSFTMVAAIKTWQLLANTSALAFGLNTAAMAFGMPPTVSFIQAALVIFLHELVALDARGAASSLVASITQKMAAQYYVSLVIGKPLVFIVAFQIVRSYLL